MMVKILPRKMEKQLSKGVKSARKAVGSSTENIADKTTSVTGRSAATALGVALVGAAGVTAAFRYLRHTNGVTTTLHIVPDGEEGWRVENEQAPHAVSSFGTKREALRAGRAAAADSAPSRLIIHRADGSISRSHRYDPT